MVLIDLFLSSIRVCVWEIRYLNFFSLIFTLNLYSIGYFKLHLSVPVGSFCPIQTLSKPSNILLAPSRRLARNKSCDHFLLEWTLLAPAQRWRNTPLNSFLFFSQNDKNSLFYSEGQAIWMDENIRFGKTDRCQTFNNPPLCPSGDFEIRVLEVYGFATDQLS